jgi:hypothetical protein
LIIKKIRESDVGVYTCSAVNKEGSAESSGNLEIVEFIEKGRSDAPEFLKKIGDELVFRGMSARFTALVTGFPEPDYEFSLNGKPVFPTDRIHMTKERSGLIRLSMPFVEESDIGVYGLRVWNQHGQLIHRSLYNRVGQPIACGYFSPLETFLNPFQVF